MNYSAKVKQKLLSIIEEMDSSGGKGELCPFLRIFYLKYSIK